MRETIFDPRMILLDQEIAEEGKYTVGVLEDWQHDFE
jgi:hypothetical protein